MLQLRNGRRYAAAALLGIILALLASTPATAADCEFRLGFKTLRDLIGHDIVGECLENEHYNASGDREQETTGGLLVLRKADNRTVFTDGARTWINGPYGLQKRINWRRFPWEPDYRPEIAATPLPVPSSVPTQTPTPPPLTRGALRNAEYRNSLFAHSIVSDARMRFLDGGYRTVHRYWSNGKQYQQNVHMSLLERDEILAFGDLDGDGSDDAALIISIYQGGTSTYRYLTAVLNDGGAATHMASTFVGLKVGIESVTIANGSILLRTTEQAPDDPSCCPSLKMARTYRLAGNALQALSEASEGRLTQEEIDRRHTWVPPTPTPPRPSLDPERVDTALASALGLVQDAFYDWFVASDARAQFGSLEGYTSRYDFSPLRITINEGYRNESQEALAHTLIWPLASLHAIDERGASPWSWNECIFDAIAAHAAQARWWLEKYGASGKQNPTELEQWANGNLESYLDMSLGSWVRETYREQCAAYGEPPPLPMPTPVPTLTLPWDYLVIDLGNLLEDRGLTPGSAQYFLMRNYLTSKYGYLPHSLFLAWLDASGRGTGDATPELWQEFFRAFLLNQEFRALSKSAVREYLEANTQLGPVLTAFLKASHIGSLDERVHFVARVEDALRVGGILGRDASDGCSIHCQHVKTNLRAYLAGRDLATITETPNPWYKN